jgi:hypothetical protein
VLSILLTEKHPSAMYQASRSHYSVPGLLHVRRPSSNLVHL